jgi:hypothetical protein
MRMMEGKRDLAFSLALVETNDDDIIAGIEETFGSI